MSQKVKSDEEKDLDVRKDLFWRTFFLMFFAGGFIYSFLAVHHLDNSITAIIIFVLCLLGTIFLPGYFYKLKWVQKQYDIFQNKKWQTATDKNERANAKTYYNLILFFLLSFFGWLAAGVVAEFVFQKNDNVKAILEVVFILFALAFSIWITEKKSKPNESNINKERE